MQLQHTTKLAARLEHAHKMSNAERYALLKDLERYAAQDLYGAARLCENHLHKDADLRLPANVQIAPLVAKHFEQRMDRERRAIDVHTERDRQLRQPEAGKQYAGPIVGTTPNCVVQMDRDTGDFIVHARQSLVCAFEPNARHHQVSIHYPQAAIGGVGLVTQNAGANSPADGHQHSHQAEHHKPTQAMELGR